MGDLRTTRRQPLLLLQPGQEGSLLLVKWNSWKTFLHNLLDNLTTHTEVKLQSLLRARDIVLTCHLRPRSQLDPPRPSPGPYFGTLCLHLGHTQSIADSYYIRVVKTLMHVDLQKYTQYFL